MPSIGLQLENVWGAILYSLLVICLSNYGMDSATGNKRGPFNAHTGKHAHISTHARTHTHTHTHTLFNSPHLAPTPLLN